MGKYQKGVYAHNFSANSYNFYPHNAVFMNAYKNKQIVILFN